MVLGLVTGSMPMLFSLLLMQGITLTMWRSFLDRAIPRYNGDRLRKTFEQAMSTTTSNIGGGGGAPQLSINNPDDSTASASAPLRITEPMGSSSSFSPSGGDTVIQSLHLLSKLDPSVIQLLNQLYQKNQPNTIQSQTTTTLLQPHSPQLGQLSNDEAMSPTLSGEANLYPGMQELTANIQQYGSGNEVDSQNPNNPMKYIELSSNDQQGNQPTYVNVADDQQQYVQQQQQYIYPHTQYIGGDPQQQQQQQQPEEVDPTANYYQSQQTTEVINENEQGGKDQVQYEYVEVGENEMVPTATSVTTDVNNNNVEPQQQPQQTSVTKDENYSNKVVADHSAPMPALIIGPPVRRKKKNGQQKQQSSQHHHHPHLQQQRRLNKKRLKLMTNSLSDIVKKHRIKSKRMFGKPHQITKRMISFEPITRHFQKTRQFISLNILNSRNSKKYSTTTTTRRPHSWTRFITPYRFATPSYPTTLVQTVRHSTPPPPPVDHVKASASRTSAKTTFATKLEPRSASDSKVSVLMSNRLKKLKLKSNKIQLEENLDTEENQLNSTATRMKSAKSKMSLFWSQKSGLASSSRNNSSTTAATSSCAPPTDTIQLTVHTGTTKGTKQNTTVIPSFTIAKLPIESTTTESSSDIVKSQLITPLLGIKTTNEQNATSSLALPPILTTTTSPTATLTLTSTEKTLEATTSTTTNLPTSTTPTSIPSNTIQPPPPPSNILSGVDEKSLVINSLMQNLSQILASLVTSTAKPVNQSPSSSTTTPTTTTTTTSTTTTSTTTSSPISTTTMPPVSVAGLADELPQEFLYHVLMAINASKIDNYQIDSPAISWLGDNKSIGKQVSKSFGKQQLEVNSKGDETVDNVNVGGGGNGDDNEDEDNNQIDWKTETEDDGQQVDGKRRVSHRFKRVCYYLLDGGKHGQLEIAQLELHICSHLIVGYARISANGLVVAQKPLEDSEKYRQLTLMKLQHPQLKVLLSIGDLGGISFSIVASSNHTRERFVESLLDFCEEFNFDGVDIDWEFPTFRTGFKEDRTNLILLLDRLRARSNQIWHSKSKSKKDQSSKFLISVAVGAPLIIASTSYTIPELGKVVDFVNLMSYDFHYYRSDRPYTGHHAPLYPRSSEQAYYSTLNVAWAATYWANQGMPIGKIIVGVPTYARTYNLVVPIGQNVINAPASGPGLGRGKLNYSEVCQFLHQSGTSTHFDVYSQVPYAYKNYDWIAYENEMSVAIKTQWVIKTGMGGIVTFALNFDDAKGVCREDGKRYPLQKIISNLLELSSIKSYKQSSYVVKVRHKRYLGDKKQQH